MIRLIYTEADERKRLHSIVMLVEKNLADKRKSLIRLDSLDLDEYVLNDLTNQHLTRIKNLEHALNSPYFARVDFIQEGKEETESFYIGKVTILENEDAVVLDWRAPFSSIYYEGGLGDVSYQCPDGIIRGQLTLKRQYQIEHGDLLHFQDIDITTNDSFLQEILSSNGEARLKNIVSTIQSEQNRIIRADMQSPLIVQGVAGSGKTTVALHRIAYLVYTYETTIRPEEFLILAPNKFLLDYVSGVLPDLGVDFARQETMEDFAKSIIREKITIRNSNAQFVGGVMDPDAKSREAYAVAVLTANYKTSLAFKETIDSYLDMLNDSILPKRDFTIGSYAAIKYKQLQSTFMDYADRLPLAARINRLKQFMQNWMTNNAESLAGRILSDGKQAMAHLPDRLQGAEKSARQDKIWNETEAIVKELRKGGKKFVTEYIKKIKLVSVWEHYKTIMQSESLFESYLEKETIAYMLKSFTTYMRKKNVEQEDIPALLYLQYKLFGVDENFSLKHIIIDEAQDCGLFQFFVLHRILGCDSMTILGDLAQGIYSYRGLDSWERLNEAVFHGEASVEYMQISYRTTVEIMEEANKVLSTLKGKLNLELAIPAIRHGQEVCYRQSKNLADLLTYIPGRISELKDEGYQTIAIISRTNAQSKAIYESLMQTGEDARLLSDNSLAYEGGVTIMPSYLSKGLEFDAVLITDADKTNYPGSDTEAKLLYVSMTRAMHHLDILYEGELTALLCPSEYL